MSALIPFRTRPLFASPGFGDFSSMLDDFFGDITPAASRPLVGGFRVDIRENEDSYQIDAELPGVGKDEVKLELNDGLLSIRVDREESKEETKDNYIHRERRYGSMSRSFRLADFKADEVSARFDNGILQITVPKAEPSAKVRQIEIQ